MKTETITLDLVLYQLLSIHPDDGLLTERILLTREQAMDLLEQLPGFIAQMPASITAGKARKP